MRNLPSTTAELDGIYVITNEDCTTSLLYSDLLQSFDTAVNAYIVSVKNLMTDVVTDFEITSIDVVDSFSSVTLDLETNLSTNESTIQHTCKFLGCDVKCKLLEADTEAYLLYNTLQETEDCECGCEDKFKNIYEALLAMTCIKYKCKTVSNCIGCQ